MMRWLPIFVLIGLAWTPADAQGISARSRAESLAGLNGVHVIVEDLSEVATQAGLTSAAIKSAVEARLSSKGIPVLGLGALTMDPRGPTLLVRVDLDFSDPVYYYGMQVQFFQNVTLISGDDLLAKNASASTWQRSEFARIGKFRVATLPQEVNKLVDAFVTDYFKFNEPPAPALAEDVESEEGLEAAQDSVETEPDGN